VECQPFRPLFGTRLVHFKRAKLSAKAGLFGRMWVRKTGFRVNFGPRWYLVGRSVNSLASFAKREIEAKAKRKRSEIFAFAL